MHNLLTRSRRSPAALAALALLLVLPSLARAVSPSIGRKQPCELCEYSTPVFWIVNARCAPRCRGLDAGFEKLRYERYDPACKKFVCESRAAFLAEQADLPTLLFVHGNTLDYEAAIKYTWPVYERLKVCPGPKMFVLWIWPAEVLYKRPLVRPVKLVRDNLKAKYVYSEMQGYYVAKLTSMMSLNCPLTLGGHSYGGVSAIVALHYMAGGCLNGLVLDTGAPVERPNLRAAIISGALDNDHVYPGCRYGEAFVPVEKFYTTFNDRDATLKRWPNISQRGKEAMGFTGICAARLGPNAHKLCQQRLTEDVNKSHYIKPHLASTKMMSAICRTAFNTDVSVCNCPSCSGKRSSGEGRRSTLDMQGMMQVPTQIVFPALAL